MGGHSQGQLSFAEGALCLSGHVSTRNGGGFLQARRDDTRLPDWATVLHLTLRCTSGSCALHLRSHLTRRPWEHYRATLPAPAQWTTLSLPLAAFRPSRGLPPGAPRAADIRSLGLLATGPDHDAGIFLRRIEIT